jgi:hypothetical protein
MLVVTAKGHVFFELRYMSVNACLPVTHAKGPLEQILVKALPSGYLRSKDGRLHLLVTLSNPRKNLLGTLGGQLAITLRTVLLSEPGIE